MDDPRPRVTVDQPIDLAALDAALGGVGLSARLDDDGQTVEVVAPESVTMAALQAAIDDHVPQPPSPSDMEVLQATVDQLVLDALMGGL